MAHVGVILKETPSERFSLRPLGRQNDALLQSSRLTLDFGIVQSVIFPIGHDPRKGNRLTFRDTFKIVQMCDGLNPF